MMKKYDNEFKEYLNDHYSDPHARQDSKNRDYERLLESCTRLYDELESAMNSVDLLVSDINMASEEIHDSFFIIDERMERCTQLLRHLSYRPLSMFLNLQCSEADCGQETDEV